MEGITSALLVGRSALRALHTHAAGLRMRAAAAPESGAIAAIRTLPTALSLASLGLTPASHRDYALHRAKTYHCAILFSSPHNRK